MKKFPQLLAVSLLVSAPVLTLAKLPPLSAEDKVKAAEAAAKTAWSSKVDIYQLCKSQDKVAASYYESARAAGKETKSATATPACTDPGAFVYTPLDTAKPLEASGAHSPAATAASPPSSNQPDAVVNPVKKL